MYRGGLTKIANLHYRWIKEAPDILRMWFICRLLQPLIRDIGGVHPEGEVFGEDAVNVFPKTPTNLPLFGALLSVAEDVAGLPHTQLIECFMPPHQFEAQVSIVLTSTKDDFPCCNEAIATGYDRVPDACVPVVDERGE